MVSSRLASVIREQPLALPAAFLLVLWLQLFGSLTPFWRLGTYYDYGWFVPLAAGWFFWKRWQTLQSRLPTTPAWPRWADTAALTLLLSAVFLFFLIRIVGRYDPLWRPPRLVHAALVCGIHHTLLARFLGWRNSAFFVPVTLFCLTAVPMPQSWEQSLIHQATHHLMMVSEPICHFQGLPVELSGSALTMEGVVLEIDEGCSGIRSFQSLFMVALFAGEFFLLGWISRIGLVFFGIAYAFLFNTVRVIVLTHIYFGSGDDAFHFWHDTVGTGAFALSALALLGTAKLFHQLPAFAAHILPRPGSQRAVESPM